MSEPAQTSLLAFLFTDLVDSTALKRKLGDVEGARAIAAHDALFRECVARNGGTEQNNPGDGFFATFPVPSAALKCALEFQSGLADLPVQSRVGIHMGESVHAPGTHETKLLGLAVDTAGRVMSLALPDQILVTRHAFDSARQQVLKGPGGEKVLWRAHGAYHFKGLDEPVEIHEAGLKGLAPLAPPPDSAKAKRALAPGEEETLGWRPAAGLGVPGRRGWKLEKKLGEGGFGEAWLAVHERTKDKRAFKFCFRADRLRSLKRELTLFRLLKETLGERDDIARLYDVRLDEAPYFLEMEYTAGGSLDHWGPAHLAELDLKERIEFVAQIADALAAAHSVGVLHKDVKPSNVLVRVDREGKPHARLTDFGIGQLMDPEALAAAQISGTGFGGTKTMADLGSRTGTRMYMAPELWMGRPASIASDVYALGIVLYQVVAGDMDRPLAQGWERDVDDPLVAEDIARCVAGDPGARPASCDLVARDLRSLDARRRARTAERQRAERERRRGRLLRVTGVAAAVLLLLAGVAGYGYRSAETERKAAVKARRSAETARGQAETALEQRGQALAEAERERNAAVEAKSEADAAREEAETALREARAQALANAAASETRERPMLALLLAREAARLAPTAGVMDRLREALTASHERVVFRGHEKAKTGELHNGVHDAVFTPDGKQVVTGGHDGTVRFWDLDGNEVGRLTGHRLGVTDLKFAKDGDVLVTASSDDTIRLWRDGQCIVTCEGHEPYIRRTRRSSSSSYSFPVRVAISPDGTRLATAAQDSTVRLWDAEGSEIARIDAHEGVSHWQDPAVLRFTPDSAHLLTCWRGKQAILWDRDGNEVRRFDHGAAIEDAALSPDGKLALTGGTDDRAVLWELDGTLRARLDGHAADVAAVAFHPGQRAVLTAGADGKAKLWTLGGGTIATYDAERAGLVAAAFSPRGDRVLAVSADGVVFVWDIGGERLATLRGHTRKVASACFSPDGERVLTASRDGTARLWAVRSGEGRVIAWTKTSRTRKKGEKEWRLKFAPAPVEDFLFLPDDGAVLTWANNFFAPCLVWGPSGPPEHVEIRAHGFTRVDLAPDGRTLLAYSGMGHSRSDRVFGALIDLDEGSLVDLKGHGQSVWGGCFSPDGSYAATSSPDGTVRLWNRAGESIAVLNTPFAGSLLAISPDGRRLLTGKEAGTVVHLWDRSGKRLAALEHGGQVRSAAFSPDGSHLLTASHFGRALVWDADGNLVHRLLGHAGPVQCAVFDRSPRRVVTGSIDGTVRIWEDGRATAILGGHLGWVETVEVHPETGDILTTSRDGTARLWSEAGEPRAVFRDDAPIVQARFSLDGRRVGTRSEEHVIRVWLARDGDVLALADRRITRGFTVAELERHGELLDPGKRARLEEARRERRKEQRKSMARTLAQVLRRRLLIREDVVAYLEETDDYDPEVRKLALEHAREGRKAHPHDLNPAAWKRVARPGATPEEVARAVRFARAAVQRAPRVASYRNTLGVALYRAGEHEEALEVLAEAMRRNERGSSYNPAADLAPRAMCLWRLGRKDEARRALVDARTHEAADDDTRALVAEAAELIGE